MLLLWIALVQTSAVGLHPYPHGPKGMLKDIPALIILKPCFNCVGFTVASVRGNYAPKNPYTDAPQTLGIDLMRAAA